MDKPDDLRTQKAAALLEALLSWEGYDESLTPAQNYIEMQLCMGLVEASAHYLLRFSKVPPSHEE